MKLIFSLEVFFVLSVELSLTTNTVPKFLAFLQMSIIVFSSLKHGIKIIVGILQFIISSLLCFY